MFGRLVYVALLLRPDTIVTERVQSFSVKRSRLKILVVDQIITHEGRTKQSLAAEQILFLVRHYYKRAKAG